MRSTTTSATELTPRGTTVPASRGPGDEVARHIGESAASLVAGAAAPFRGVLVGPAGSGKSTALGILRDELGERGLTVTHRIDAPHDHIVVVDDAHALDDAQVEVLIARVADPTQSVVIAYRDHPGAARLLQPVAERLERSTPPVLLGETSAEQIAEATHVPLPCAHAILRRTSGLTWLTLLALDAHDAGTCEIDPEHRDLTRALRGAVTHRLAQIDPAVRPGVEALCLFPPSEIPRVREPEIGWEDTIAHGAAAGLLAANGRPPSVVRAAIRAALPVHRLAELLSLAPAEGDEEWDEDPATTAPDRLVARGDATRLDDPAGALRLYREAIASGADATPLAMRLAIAAVGIGDLDTAASCVDRVLHHPEHPGFEEAQDAAAAIWAARGALGAGGAPETATTSAATAARRALIAVGIGRRPGPPVAPSVPDTLAIASEALAGAVRASLGDDVEAAVDDLALASELYSTARSDFPLVEPPAVMAAAAAMAVGALSVADSVLESAVGMAQAGAWAQPRLRLWQAWVAIAAGRPDDARAHLVAAHATPAALQPRDRLIAAACETALARRYANTATLIGVFREARPHLLRRRFDAHLVPFLGELMLAAERVGAPETVDRHFASAMAALDALGAPPLWSPLPHWAGIQRGILSNRPDLMVPHARAMLAAADRNPLAARLADAGRVWTDVLAGRVEPQRVEAAAQTLARSGLTWDGARLAAHGAARAGDRQTYAQLLSCARELHPRQPIQPEPGRPDTAAPTGDGTVMSAREIEVARLVVQGKTYVEIGQTLFISPRTAEHHIARIRRRLDAGSRSELLTKLRDVLHADTPAFGEGAA